MPAIHYLSDLDRINTKKYLRPVIDDLERNQLYLALCLIIDGTDLKEAIDKANSIPRIRYR